MNKICLVPIDKKCLLSIDEAVAYTAWEGTL